MAEVWKAKSFGSNGFERIVAIKRILPNIAEDKEFIDMFVDEAKISVQLTHPNIAQVTDLDKVDDQYYIAMEYIQGKDLRTIFDRLHNSHTPMDISQACFIIMKVCEGLDYAHQKKDNNGVKIGIIHRDVSPQNIIVSFEGDVKIIDFGIAKAAGKASQTQAGILKGKFGYMSPEQVRGLQLDNRSDIFSLGIILYELLTNERLFQGESDFSTLEKVRNAEILPPTAYNRAIPEQLETIMLKALAKEMEERYFTALDFHEELQAFMFANGWFYSRKDLADWMKREFKKDIDEDKKKMEEYAQYTYDALMELSPRAAAPSQARPEVRPSLGTPRVAAAPPALNQGGGEFWDDDEIETAIHEKKGQEERVPKRKGAPAPMKKTLMGMQAPQLPGMAGADQQPDLADLFNESDPTPAGIAYADRRQAAPSAPQMRAEPAQAVYSQPYAPAAPVPPEDFRSSWMGAYPAGTGAAARPP
jgi:serine/threonine protein kinase